MKIDNTEMLLGFQTAIVTMLKQKRAMPPRSEWPVSIRIVIDSLRDTGLLKIVEDKPFLTPEGNLFADQIMKSHERAVKNLKSVDPAQIQKDMQFLVDVALREIQKRLPEPTTEGWTTIKAVKLQKMQETIEEVLF